MLVYIDIVSAWIQLYICWVANRSIFPLSNTGISITDFQFDSDVMPLKTIQACCRNENDTVGTKVALKTKAFLDIFDP